MTEDAQDTAAKVASGKTKDSRVSLDWPVTTGLFVPDRRTVGFSSSLEPSVTVGAPSSSACSSVTRGSFLSFGVKRWRVYAPFARLFACLDTCLSTRYQTTWMSAFDNASTCSISLVKAFVSPGVPSLDDRPNLQWGCEHVIPSINATELLAIIRRKRDTARISSLVQR